MPKNTIRAFLSGTLDIVRFREMYDTQPEINDYLQKIIDGMKAQGTPIKPYLHIRDGEECLSYGEALPYLLAPETDPGIAHGCPPRYTSVRQCLTYEFRALTHDVITASGAWTFYREVYEIFYQADQSISYDDKKYEDAFDLALDVIPEYLSGGASEHYIQKYIIPLFPETMKKAQRKKAIKEKIKEAFPREKGYPCWPQSSLWPMDREGKPATYIGKGKSEGDLRRFRFRDETTGEIIVVEDYC